MGTEEFTDEEEKEGKRLDKGGQVGAFVKVLQTRGKGGRAKEKTRLSRRRTGKRQKTWGGGVGRAEGRLSAGGRDQ